MPHQIDQSNCVTFINGDNRIENVIGTDGKAKNISMDRSNAADLFNEGKVRFLASTEAAGEGIDLQESCYSLIHVDLPWNPMRLHQRVGRLNRYGQKESVEVITLRNPATVESRIWEKLNDKINSIMRALGSAMDDPEDLLQLVLGMTSPSLFNELFSNGATISSGRLDDWFDKKTKTFGGKDAIETVRNLIGNCSRFDYQDLKEIPRMDLVDLQQFFELMLSLNKRRVLRTDRGITFKTPDEWLNDAGVRRRYEDLCFSRNIKGKDASLRVLGVGHKVFDQAINQATNFDSYFTEVSGLNNMIAVFRVYDRITSQEGHVNQKIFGIESEKSEILLDWQVIKLFNEILESKNVDTTKMIVQTEESISDFVNKALEIIKEKIDEFKLPFGVPEIKPLALFLPK